MPSSPPCVTLPIFRTHRWLPSADSRPVDSARPQIRSRQKSSEDIWRSCFWPPHHRSFTSLAWPLRPHLLVERTKDHQQNRLQLDHSIWRLLQHSPRQRRLSLRRIYRPQSHQLLSGSPQQNSSPSEENSSWSARQKNLQRLERNQRQKYRRSRQSVAFGGRGNSLAQIH